MALINHVAAIAAPVALTCHVATWFWAAQEAQAQGLTSVKPALTTLMNIAGMPGGPQGAMLGLPRSGQWNFNMTTATPPPGTVLLWLSGATHSAVVTAANQITGYNQPQQFAPAIVSTLLTTGTPFTVNINHRLCYTITEDTIVKAAGVVFKL